MKQKFEKNILYRVLNPLYLTSLFSNIIQMQSLINISNSMNVDRIFTDQMKRAAREQESKIYSDGYRVDVNYNGKLIGYAIFHDYCNNGNVKYTYSQLLTFWSAYCIVPKEWYNLFYNGIITPDNIPEITFMDKKRSIIGWDYVHYWDIFNYTNLYSVIMKICEVWNICNNKNGNK